MANDLSDIEEGRFFDGERGTYQFRPEALHFALGLLVADEVRQAVRLDAEGIDEALGAILDPIRGFDTVANVLFAAIAVASLDAGYPDGGVAALIRGWMSLQNLNDDAFEDLIPYLAARPEPFLDAFETRDMDSDDGRFLRLILCVAKLRDPVAGAIDRRVEKWLGTWSRGLPAGGDADGDRQARYNAEVNSRIALLSEEERRFPRRHVSGDGRVTGLGRHGCLLPARKAASRLRARDPCVRPHPQARRQVPVDLR